MSPPGAALAAGGVLAAGGMLSTGGGGYQRLGQSALYQGEGPVGPQTLAPETFGDLNPLETQTFGETVQGAARGRRWRATSAAR